MGEWQRVNNEEGTGECVMSMDVIRLGENQAALVLEASDEGEITVQVASPDDQHDSDNFALYLCQVIAEKLTNDEGFRNEILSELDDEDDAG